jgi:hypothetical protein
MRAVILDIDADGKISDCNVLAGSLADEIIVQGALDRLLEMENPGGNRGGGRTDNQTMETIIQNES